MMKTKKSERPGKSIDKEYEIKFWKDWIEADLPERVELVKKLPLLDKFLKMKNSVQRDMFATFINTYFEDLESAVYTKISLTNKKPERK